jgi:hypothetical protein
MGQLGNWGFWVMDLYLVSKLKVEQRKEEERERGKKHDHSAKRLRVLYSKKRTRFEIATSPWGLGEPQELERDPIQLTLPSIQGDPAPVSEVYSGPYYPHDGKCRGVGRGVPTPSSTSSGSSLPQPRRLWCAELACHLPRLGLRTIPLDVEVEHILDHPLALSNVSKCRLWAIRVANGRPSC